MCRYCKKINDMHEYYKHMHPSELADLHEEILEVQEEQLEALRCIEEIMMDYPEHEWHRRGRHSYRREGDYRDGEYSDRDYHRQGVKHTGRYGIGGSMHYPHHRRGRRY